MQYFYKRNVHSSRHYDYVVVTEDSSTDNGYTFQVGDTIERAFEDSPEFAFVRNGKTFTSFASLRNELLTHSTEFTKESHPELFI